MKLRGLKLVSFSPTGTTRAVVKAIASGIGVSRMDEVDITPPAARKKSLVLNAEEACIIGVPVYMGRVPDILTPWLQSITGGGAPTVCVVVYGNRAYEDALLELKNFVTQCGCLSVGAAAFIGEHSFASAQAPVALGRPEQGDLHLAADFGRRVGEKIQTAATCSDFADFTVPGTYPYRGSTTLWDVDFIAVDAGCVQCGVCAKICPVGAIASDNSAVIDTVKCITCCACIKRCPQKARSMKPGPVVDASNRLQSLYSEPKQPECYL